MSAAANAENKLAELARIRARRPDEGRSHDKPSRGEPTETYVHRHNIAHYRSLLDSDQLDEARCASIERLLAEEEAKSKSSASQD